jgi:phage-related tail protein
MAEEIEIIVTATGFDKVTTGLKNTTDALKTTANEAKKTGDAMKTNLNTGAAQAGQSITNLSRIVQDAPFGFIGIANNINPLVESFGRLKAETGSTGGALKALVSGLSGPGGLGLAFGVITSAITFAQIGLQAWSRGSKEAKEASFLFNDQLTSLESSFKALKISIKNTNEELAFSQKISNIRFNIGNTDDFARSLNALNTQFTTLGTAFDNTTKQRDEYLAKISEAEAIVYRLQSAEGDHTKELERANKVLDDANAGYDTAVNKLGDIALERVVVTEQLKLEKVNQEKLNAAKLKEVETIDKVLAKLREAIRDQVDIGIVFNISTLQEQANLVKGAITKLITDFNLDPNSQVILKLKADLKDIQMQIKRENVIIPVSLKLQNEKVKPLDDAALKKVLDIPSLQAVLLGSGLAEIFSFLPPGFFKPFSAESIKVLITDLNRILTNAAVTIGVSFGEALGNALSGGGKIGNFFVGIFNTIGAAMVEFGKVMIAFAIKVEAIKKFVLANPFLAVAAAVGLIAIGTAIRNRTSQNAFAVGTRNAPGGLALVGERGPELVNLPRGSQVVPAAQTSNMLGGVGDGIEIYGILRGQDIYFSNKKYSATYARTT